MAHSHSDAWCVRYECDLSTHSKIFFLFGNELEEGEQIDEILCDVSWMTSGNWVRAEHCVQQETDSSCEFVHNALHVVTTPDTLKTYTNTCVKSFSIVVARILQFKSIGCTRVCLSKEQGVQFCGTPWIPQINKQQCKCVLCIIHTEGFIHAEEGL